MFLFLLRIDKMGCNNVSDNIQWSRKNNNIKKKVKYPAKP